MRHLFVTACAVAALCGTAVAQTPATQDKSAPAAKSGSTMPSTSAPAAQPAKPNSTTTAPANKSATDKSAMDKSTDKSTMDKSAMDKPAAGSADKSTAQTATPPSGITAAKPAGEVRVTFYTVKPADVRASKLIGTTVYNVNNQSIGDIDDLIIDEGKTLRAVVIGVGGFLGMGEHDVAVEPNALVLTRNADKEDIRIVLNTTKEDLKNAPEVKFDKDSRKQASSSSSSTSTPPASGTTGASDNDSDKSGSMSKSDTKSDTMKSPDTSKSSTSTKTK
jgi:hypothetical protein